MSTRNLRLSSLRLYAAGQRSFNELLILRSCEKSNSASFARIHRQCRDLESASKELLSSFTNSASTTGTELEGCPRAKSYDIGEALAS